MSLLILPLSVLASKKSQHGFIRWALCEHPTPPCYDFACDRLDDRHYRNKPYVIMFIGYFVLIHTNIKSVG